MSPFPFTYSLIEGQAIPSYFDVIERMGPHSLWYDNITPRHDENADDKWYGDSTAEKPMSETLFYATLWILFNGAEDPYPGRAVKDIPGYQRVPETVVGDNIPGQLESLRRFFAQRFHPEWTPQQVDRFARNGKL